MIYRMITNAELTVALNLLVETRDRLIGSVAELNHFQWHCKPVPERWSIAEIVEHVVLLETGFHLRIVPGLKLGPPPVTDDPHALDALVMARVPDRSTRYEAPASLVPTGRWDEMESLQRFVDIRQKTLDFAAKPDGFRDRTVVHPFLGPLDAYQWTLMVALHSTRHTEQIYEVMESYGALSNSSSSKL